MATYLVLLNFTDKGVGAVRQTPKRAAAFAAAAAKAGVTIREQLWCIGPYDGALVLDAPDDQTVTAVMLGLAAKGNVRTQTMRAFDADQIKGVVSNMPAAAK